MGSRQPYTKQPYINRSLKCAPSKLNLGGVFHFASVGRTSCPPLLILRLILPRLMVQICEHPNGLKYKLEILLTISPSAYCGRCESSFHAGSFTNTFHFAFRSATSVNVSMYVRLGIRDPINVSPKNTGSQSGPRKDSDFRFVEHLYFQDMRRITRALIGSQLENSLFALRRH